MYIKEFETQNKKKVLINIDKVNIVVSFSVGCKVYLDCGKDISLRMTVDEFQKTISDLKLNSK